MIIQLFKFMYLLPSHLFLASVYAWKHAKSATVGQTIFSTFEHTYSVRIHPMKDRV